MSRTQFTKSSEKKQQLAGAKGEEEVWGLRLKTPTGGGDPVGVVEYD